MLKMTAALCTRGLSSAASSAKNTPLIPPKVLDSLPSLYQLPLVPLQFGSSMVEGTATTVVSRVEPAMTLQDILKENNKGKPNTLLFVVRRPG